MVKKSRSVLVVSIALTAALGLPALGYVRTFAGAPNRCGASVCSAGFEDHGGTLLRVSDDDHKRGWFRRDHGNDDEECVDDDDDRARSDVCKDTSARPAPAGAVAPPANGLFGASTPPVAVTR